MAVEREILIDRQVDRFAGMRISWGGVFGGVLVGIGTLLLLSSLGLAIGISAVDPRNTDTQTLGTGAAIWTALTLLIALFVGGWASTRLSMLWERTTAMFEGALVWILSMILILYLTANGIGLVAEGALGMASNIANQSAGNLSATAAQMQPQATATAWITFGALVLSLLAAIAGAAAGRRNAVERATTSDRARA